MVHILNPTGGDTRYCLRRQINSDFPTTVYTIVWAVYYEQNRTDLFQTPVSIGVDPSDWAKRYMAAFDGSGAISHNFAVGEGGADYYGSHAPEAGRWYRQAFVRIDDGGGNYRHRYYYDIPDMTRYAEGTSTTNAAWDGTANYMGFGSAVWTNFEGIYGQMANVKVFNVTLTEQQMKDETLGSSLYNGSLSGNVWGRFSLVSNGNDESGNGRNFSPSTANTEVIFFDDTVVSFTAAAAAVAGVRPVFVGG